MQPTVGESPCAVPGKRLSRLERTLRQTTLLGVVVERTQAGKRTIILVRLLFAEDDLQRELIQTLLAQGFQLWPGKGYWR